MEEIAKIIGVDSLGYLSIEDVSSWPTTRKSGFCTACFGGGISHQVFGPQDGGKDRFECKISEWERKEDMENSFSKATAAGVDMTAGYAPSS